MRYAIFGAALTFLYFSLPAQPSRLETDQLFAQFQNNLANCETSTDSTVHGVRTLYTNNNLSLITVSAGDNGFQKNVRWFFKNDTLIYCEQNWYDPAKHRTVDEQHFYLENNQLINWTDSDHKPVAENTDKFIKISKELHVYAAELLKKLRQ